MASFLQRRRFQQLIVGSGGSGGAGGLSWTTVFDASGTLNGTDDGNGDGGATFVIVVKAAALTSATGKTKARVTIRYGSASGTTGPASDFYFGQGAATGDEYDFNATPVAVTFPSAITPGPNLEYVSNDITLPENWDASKNYCLAFLIPGGSTLTTVDSSFSNVNPYFGGGAPSDVDKSGFVGFGPNRGWFLTKIEVSA